MAPVLAAPLTTPDGCHSNFTSAAEAQHTGCTPGEPQEMAQCSFPSSAEAFLCVEGAGEPWQGHGVSSAETPAAGSCSGVREVLRPQGRGSCGPSRAAAPGWEGNAGCSRAQAAELLVLCMHVQAWQQLRDRPQLGLLEGAGRPFAVGQLHRQGLLAFCLLRVFHLVCVPKHRTHRVTQRSTNSFNP